MGTWLYRVHLVQMKSHRPRKEMGGFGVFYEGLNGFSYVGNSGLRFSLFRLKVHAQLELEKHNY